MKKILFFLALGMALFVASQADDALNLDAATFVYNPDRTDKSDKPDSITDSRAFVYFLGISHNTPQKAGAERLAALRQRESNPDAQRAEENASLVTPAGELFCLTRESGCISTLFAAAPAEVASLHQQHARLLNNVNAFLRMDDYHTLTQPTFSEEGPPFRALRAAERIKLLGAIARYRQGKPQQALDALLEQFQTLRAMFVQQDTLIGKMVFVIMLSDVLDVASVIANQEDIQPLNISSIAPLTSAEKNFAMVAKREFAGYYHLFKNLEKELKAENSAWIARILYKPNMSLNAVAPDFARFSRLTQLSPVAFVEAVSPENGKNLSESLSWLYKARNYMGYQLLIVGQADFDRYAGRMHRLNAKIELFNEYVVKKNRPASSIANPFYPGKTAYETDTEQGGQLCFAAPVDESTELRCLQTSVY